MIVRCAAIECKHNGKNCKCTKKSICLSSQSVMTVWEGRQDFLKCGEYEVSEEYLKTLAQVVRVLGGGGADEDTP